MIITKTFTSIYDETEDRIRLAINYQDPSNRIDFMITRKFVIKLFPVLEDNYYKYFDNNEILPETNKTNTNSKTDSVTFQLIMDKTELLQKVDINYDVLSKKLCIKLYGKTTSAIAYFDNRLYLAFLKILQSSIPSYAWGIHKLIDL